MTAPVRVQPDESLEQRIARVSRERGLGVSSTPTNGSGETFEQRIARITKERNIPVAIENAMAPLLVQPRTRTAPASLARFDDVLTGPARSAETERAITERAAAEASSVPVQPPVPTVPIPETPAPFAAENARRFQQLVRPGAAPLDATVTPATAPPRVAVEDHGDFGKGVEALASTFSNPAAAVAQTALAIPHALRVAASPSEKGSPQLFRPGTDEPLPSGSLEPASDKDAAIAAAQLAALAFGPAVSRGIGAVASPLLGEAGGALAGRVLAGAGGGAAFMPEHPILGAALGGAAGGLHAVASHEPAAAMPPEGANLTGRPTRLLANPRRTTATAKIDPIATAPEPVEPPYTVETNASRGVTNEPSPKASPMASPAATTTPRKLLQPAKIKEVTRDNATGAERATPDNTGAKRAGNEPETTAHEFSSTQLNLPPETSAKIKELGAKIPDSDLAADGRETTPHVTIKYGLHGDEVDAVRRALADEPPVTVKLGKTSVFPNGESNAGDVVKVDVDSPELHTLNQKIAAAAPHTDTHPEYKPHVTLAYVKPGLGEKYSGNAALEGHTVTLDHVTFSDRSGKTTDIPLTGSVSPTANDVGKRESATAPPSAGPDLSHLETPPVLEARRWAETQSPTHLIDTPERQELRGRIASHLVGDGAQRHEKEWTFWIGLPASGKSSLAEAYARERGALLLDSDDAKRQLPEYLAGKGTSVVHREGTLIRNMAVRRAVADGSNIVVPTVGHDLAGLHQEIKDLSDAGWKVHVRFADLAHEKAADRAVARYENGGIFVDPHYIASIADAPKATYEALKLHPGITSYAKFDTDTPRGTPPRLVESNESTGRSVPSADERRGAEGVVGEVPPRAGGPGVEGLGGEPTSRAGGDGTAPAPEQRQAGRVARPTDEGVLRQAFADWSSGRAYLGNDGNYRLKGDRGKAGEPVPEKLTRATVAPWNKAVKAAFPNNADFHRAATEAKGRTQPPRGGATSYANPFVDPNVLKGAAKAAAETVRDVAERVKGTGRAGLAPLTPEAEAAFRSAEQSIDFSGELARGAKRRGRGSFTDRLNRLGDRLANGFGPIERLGADDRVQRLLPPTRNPGDLLSLVKSGERTIRAFLDEGAVDPITRETTGPSFREVFAPLRGDTEAIRRALTYVKAERDVGRGLKGMGEDEVAFAEAQTIVEHGRRDPTLTAFADRWKQYVDGVGQYAVKSGLWTPAMWEKLQASDVLYVRYKRILDASVRRDGGGTARARGGKLANVSSQVDRFQGSRRAIEHPVEAMAEYTAQIIRAADRYRVGSALFDAVDALGPEGAFVMSRIPASAPEVRPAKLAAAVERAKEFGVDPEVMEDLAGQFTTHVSPSNPVVWRNGPDGKREHALIHSVDLWNAVNALSPDGGGVRDFLNVTLRPLKRVFTAATTGLNPRFALATNPARDIVDALGKSQAGVTPRDIARGYREAIKGVVGKSATMHEAEMSGIGGASAFEQPTNPKNAARRLAPTSASQKLLDQLTRNNPATVGLKTLERAGEVSDKGPRLAEYMAAVRKYSHLVDEGIWTPADLRLRAATYARGVTLDFSNRPGDPRLRLLADFVPFFGVALQGPVKFTEASMRNPRRMAAVATGVAAAAVIAWAMKRAKDDEARATMNDRLATERAAFLEFPLDSTGKNVFRLPMGQEFGIIAAGVTSGLDAAFGDDPNAGKVFAQSLIRALPPGISELVEGNLTVPIPGAQQLLENAKNRKDYGGRPIEPRGVQDLPPAERRSVTTAPTFDALAAGARRVGFSNTSPLQAENAVHGVLSNATNFATAATDPIARKLTGRSAKERVPTPMLKNPLNPLSAIIGGPSPSTESEQQYYKLRERVGQATAFLNRAASSGDTAAIPRLRPMRTLFSEDAKTVIEVADDLLKATREERAAIQAAYRANEINAAEARLKIDVARDREQHVYRRAVTALKRAGVTP